MSNLPVLGSPRQELVSNRLSPPSAGGSLGLRSPSPGRGAFETDFGVLAVPGDALSPSRGVAEAIGIPNSGRPERGDVVVALRPVELHGGVLEEVRLGHEGVVVSIDDASNLLVAFRDQPHQQWLAARQLDVLVRRGDWVETLQDMLVDPDLGVVVPSRHKGIILKIDIVGRLLIDFDDLIDLVWVQKESFRDLAKISQPLHTAISSHERQD